MLQLNSFIVFERRGLSSLDRTFCMGQLYYAGIFVLQIESQFSKNENNFKYFDFKTLGLIFLEAGYSDMVLEDVTEL